MQQMWREEDDFEEKIKKDKKLDLLKIDQKCGVENGTDIKFNIIKVRLGDGLKRGDR